MEHALEAEATAAEQAAVDEVLGRSASSWEGAQRSEHDLRVSFARDDRGPGRDLLLPTLRALQSRAGWISQGGLGYVCRRLSIAPADAYGVASFYGLFSLEPSPARVVHVCTDLACKLNGADAVVEQLRVGEAPTGAREMSTWRPTPCLGLCERAPAALVIHAGDPPYEAPLPSVDADAIRVAMNGAIAAAWAHAASVPQRDGQGLVLLRRVGVVDPASLDDYVAHGGRRALARAFELGPEGVVREVLDSGLVGRGGAAFPTGRKWQAVREHERRPHVVVCNADESEPGTFKDRVLMEGDPFAVIEAITIAGYATGCERGYIYLRGEYPIAFERLDHAITTARAAGWLGDDIGRSGFSFDIEIRRGAGAYICGEETAIFNSIEGYRGEPRNKPPYPTDVGLFGLPTVVNNVETLVNVLPILEHGATAYVATGTEGSTGTKLFCLSGCVARPGVYEVEFGISLRDLLAMAGGVRGGRALQCVLLGGAAGMFVRADEIDLALTFEGTRAASASLGSGVVLVLDDTVDLVAFLRRIAAFFREESCGQCVPCRIGAVRQDELLERLAAGHPRQSVDAELTLLSDIAQAMRDASICGLGQTAGSAIESAMVKLQPFRRSR
ncbi:MAG TPA: NAD(P)H-dependent oxidoreductase subunit E [Acidimicrobiales bacterium]|nr:NAD(P)H-dependent oxidoreductase subunit E [Acidimicrobiales bacterium]